MGLQTGGIFGIPGCLFAPCANVTPAMAESVAKFVSQKISKIRWRPTSKQVLSESDVFATGSWDNYVSRCYGISLKPFYTTR